MVRFIAVFSFLLLLTACGEKQPETIELTNVYSIETAGNFSVGAAFMTITNNTDVDDRMIGFRSDYGQTHELHTMVMQGDIMRMRGVESFPVASGESHTLEPGGDHVMIYGIGQNLSAGDSFEAVAIFEQAGEIPVTVAMRTRDEVMSTGKDE
jgi:copper(I)-binding protein